MNNPRPLWDRIGVAALAIILALVGLRECGVIARAADGTAGLKAGYVVEGSISGIVNAFDLPDSQHAVFSPNSTMVAVFGENRAGVGNLRLWHKGNVAYFRPKPIRIRLFDENKVELANRPVLLAGDEPGFSYSVEVEYSGKNYRSIEISVGDTPLELDSVTVFSWKDDPIVDVRYYTVYLPVV